MSITEQLTPAQRDALGVLLALALLAGPLWASALHLGDPTYRYERARVVVGERGLSYADESTAFSTRPISEDIGCSVGYDLRVCAFESYLAENHTIPTGFNVGVPRNPRDDGSGETMVDYPGIRRYEYVLVDGTMYEVSAVANRSVQNRDGMYRLDLALERRSVDRVLREVSLRLSDRRDQIPPAVRDAATDGVGRSHREVDVPKTPIRLDDGTYYRVYLDGRTEASIVEHFFGGLLTYAAPVVGLLALFHLSGRFRVTYVGDDS